MLKRLTSGLLVCLFLYSSSGFYLNFRYSLQQIRKEIKTRIKQSVPENELITLSFNTSSSDYANIEWIEGHEFRYRGCMYDIVQRFEDGSETIVFKCINDTQEEKLFQHLDELVVANSDKSMTGKNHQKSVYKSIDLFACITGPEILPMQMGNYPRTTFSMTIAPLLWNASPPPEFC
jgi:hypothetical protein